VGATDAVEDHVSNALGTIVPVKRMIEAAHRAGIAVLVDGAQAAPHLRVDVQDLDCDFYTFSGQRSRSSSSRPCRRSTTRRSR
jgi:selenocysteine lyase/cysteine desulfurase